MIKKVVLLIFVGVVSLTLVSCKDKKVTIPKPSTLQDSKTGESDGRSESVYEFERIIIDNEHKELTYKQASTYKYNAGKTAIGSNFLSSEKGANFSATYTPKIVEAGYYKIYINYPTFEGAYNKVPIVVNYEGGNNIDDTRVVNQTINAGRWVMVGTYYLTKGNDNSVVINSVENENIIADAMMFELSSSNDELQTEDKPVLVNPYEPISVTNIVKSHEYEVGLTVDGEPYFVKGVNGIGELELIAEAGGNSVRTYSPEALEGGLLLDQAEALGIKVIIGLWMNHESSKFTYANNKDAVEAQYQRIIQEVEKYKSHPAVLGWAVGNEVDNSTSANMKAIYDAMNDIAAYIKVADPYHPTVAVLAGSSPMKIGQIRRFAQHIDIIGINTYSAIKNVTSNILGWKGPYMITEYALNQPMETKLKTAWGAIIEPNSIEKANLYYQRYQEYIYGKRNEGVVGSYVFKDTGSFRITHTWYGIILNGKKTAAYEGVLAGFKEMDRRDVLQISDVSINGQSQLESVVLDNGVHDIKVTGKFIPSDATYTYEVRRDVGLSVNTVPTPIQAFSFEQKSTNDNVSMTVPKLPGNYRLFVYVEDSEYISSFSFPFQVDGEPFVLEDQTGVQIVTVLDDNYIENGSFSNSTNKYYNGQVTRFTRDLGAFGTFKPQLINPGKYEVFYYNISESMGQSDDATIEINVYYANGEVEQIIFDATSNQLGFVSLGEYSFNADGLERVTISKMLDGNKVTRTTAVGFLPKN